MQLNQQGRVGLGDDCVRQIVNMLALGDCMIEGDCMRKPS